MKMILTSFQDFPCARRGYTGAFGLMNVTLFECAMSFGCSNIKMHIVICRGTQRKLRMVKSLAA